MKYFYYVFIFFCITIRSYSQTLNENGLNLKDYDIIYTNQSILQCGQGKNLAIYSSFDIKILLAISNAISTSKVMLNSNWDNLNPPALNSNNFNEKRIPDVLLTVLSFERVNLY